MAPDSPTPENSASIQGERTPPKTTMRKLHITRRFTCQKGPPPGHATVSVPTPAEILATRSEMPGRRNPHVPNTFRQWPYRPPHSRLTYCHMRPAMQAPSQTYLPSNASCHPDWTRIPEKNRLPPHVRFTQALNPSRGKPGTNSKLETAGNQGLFSGSAPVHAKPPNGGSPAALTTNGRDIRVSSGTWVKRWRLA